MKNIIKNFDTSLIFHFILNSIKGVLFSVIAMFIAGLIARFILSAASRQDILDNIEEYILIIAGLPVFLAGFKTHFSFFKKLTNVLDPTENWNHYLFMYLFVMAIFLLPYTIYVYVHGTDKLLFLQFELSGFYRIVELLYFPYAPFFALTGNFISGYLLNLISYGIILYILLYRKRMKQQKLNDNG